MTNDPIAWMLRELNHAAGWNRIGSDVQERALRTTVEIMNDELLDPGLRLQAVKALQTSTSIGIKAIDSITRLMEVKVLAGQVRELEAIVRDQDQNSELPPLPDYELPGPF